MGLMGRPENEFERKVRESEQALLLDLPEGKRPALESWWWFAIVTGQFWVRTLLWPFTGDPTGIDTGFAITGLVLLLAGAPAFAWNRRRAARRRETLRAARAAQEARPR